MYQIYLNNILLEDEPIGMDDFTETISYDSEKLGFIQSTPLELTFWGHGYNILNTLLNDNGFCYDAALIIKQYKQNTNTYETVYIGIIKLSTCVRINAFGTNNDLNPKACLIKADIVDNGYLAYINNNRNLKVYLNSAKSKDGSDITPITPIELDIFETDGSYIGSTRKCYDIYDTLEFLVSFMSNNTMAFQSDYFSSLTDVNTKFCITVGSRLRTTSEIIVPEVSFQECLVELYKKFNVKWDIVSDAYGNLTFVLEPDTYFKYQDSSVALNNIADVEVSFDASLLYSQINLGSDTSVYDIALGDIFPPVQMLAFKRESYIFQTTCNTAGVLDLVSSWIIDTNIIARLAGASTDDTWDNDIFLVEYVPSTSKAYRSQYLATPTYYYNDSLINNNCVDRFSLQGAISKFLEGNNNENVYAYNSLDVTLDGDWGVAQTYTFKYLNEIQDAGGNYNPATGEFTAPFSGLFGFDLNWHITVDNGLEMTTAGVNVAKTTQYSISYVIDGTPYVYAESNIATEVISQVERNDYLRLYLDAGQVVKFQVELTPILYNDFIPTSGTFVGMYVVQSTNDYYQNVDYLKGGVVSDYFTYDTTPFVFEWAFLGITALSYAGGTYNSSDPNEYYNAVIKFNHPIRQDVWKAIKDNKSKSILLNGQYKGWIRNISRNLTTGMAEVELMSNLNNI